MTDKKTDHIVIKAGTHIWPLKSEEPSGKGFILDAKSLKKDMKINLSSIIGVSPGRISELRNKVGRDVSQYKFAMYKIHTSEANVVYIGFYFKMENNMS